MINQHQTLQVGGSYQDTGGGCFKDQLDCINLCQLAKNSGFKSNIRVFFTITWDSFDPSASNFAGGYVISRRKWRLILESIGL